MSKVRIFSTDEQIKESIRHLESIKQAMDEGKIAKNESDMKGNLPKLMFSERTADELMQAVLEIKRLRGYLGKIADLHIRGANDAGANEHRRIAKEALE